MTKHVNSGLLRMARQLQGLSQGDAADRLGIPQVTLSRYENAVAVPPEEVVSRAAMAYDLPPSFFEQSDTVIGAPVSVHPMWRKKQDVTVRDMDRIVAEINIRAMHIRRMLNAVEYAPQLTIPRLDPEDYGGDIERIAGIVRAHWLLPSGPIENLTAAVEKAGGVVVLSSLGGSSVSGVTVAVPGLLPLIILNEDQPADRLRFTLAHELGHLVMHHFPSPKMEQEANEFASALLLPKSDMVIALRGRPLDLPRLASLKPEWRVSMQAILYRAQSLGLVDKKRASWLWRQFNAQRIKMREPVSLDFPMEQPGVISRMVRLHLDTFGYTTRELAEILHIHERQLGAFYNLSAAPPVAGLRLKVVR